MRAQRVVHLKSIVYMVLLLGLYADATVRYVVGKLVSALDVVIGYGENNRSLTWLNANMWKIQISKGPLSADWVRGLKF